MKPDETSEPSDHDPPPDIPPEEYRALLVAHLHDDLATENENPTAKWVVRAVGVVVFAAITAMVIYVLRLVF